MDRRNTHLRRAVFIDRDGTLSEEVGYINHPSRFRLFPFAAKAIRRLNEAGWLAVLVTNQAGVARGYFTEDLLLEVHRMLQDALEKQGAHLDAIYYCPHHPAAGKPPYKLDCDCRKPKPGLIHRAARELEIDLQRSWMIGDRYSDVELARNAGVRAAFVLTGYGLGEWEYQRDQWKQMPDLVAADLGEAVERIILFDEQKRLESR
mgnify:FL=1